MSLFGGKRATANLSSVDPSKKLLSDSSSLVDLKAEVFRKHQEAQFNKLHGKSQPSVAVQGVSCKDAVWSKKNTGVKKRQEVDLQHWEESQQNDERVKESLKKKAELYDQLKKGSVEDEDRFLVKFGRQDRSSDEEEEDADESGEQYESRNDDEEWTEYTDALGRTRVCMKRDLRELRRQDKDLAPSQKVSATPVGFVPGSGDQQSTSQGGASFAVDTNPDLLSDDMRREILRQKWEKEEEENLKKRNLHYQDVLFDEARSHGAGFYRFSKDEATRSSEQEELDQLHRDTERAREQAEKGKSKRKAAMEARLKKVRDRKRLKMGLPLVEDDDDEEEGGKKELSEDDDEPREEVKEKTVEDSIMEGLKALREKERELKRKAAVREWDVGKEGVVVASSSSIGRSNSSSIVGEKKILNQKEWVKSLRRSRPDEFAPPSAYDPGQRQTKSANEAPPRQPQQSYSKMYAKSNVASSPYATPGQNISMSKFTVPPPNMYGGTWATPPPPPPPPPRPPPSSSFDHHPPSLQKRPTSVSFSIARPTPGGSAGIRPSDPMKALNKEKGGDVVGPLPRRRDDYRHVDDEEEQEDETEPLSQVSLGERLRMFRDAVPKATERADQDEEDEDLGRGKKAEIAPPCSMEYFSRAGEKSNSDFRSGFRTRQDVADAFKFGVGQSAKQFNREGEDSDDSD